ncbi:restriction endonuclease [Sporosarcina siberiensis]|uniref:Restriction endonuclease n=1 Tax=Sporosarcina siberiensis TaxID=1365606 RepID=A0ABW4SH14_9BACL
MQNRTKKQQKEMDSILGLLILVAALVGWYKFGSLKGVAVTVGVTFGLIIIFSIWRKVRFKKRMHLSGITEIDQMSGFEFEEYVGTLFETLGYRVTYTPTTGDYGADLILKKGKDVIVVQAKRYNSSVGIAAVQEVIPALKMYNANAAWVISNSYYTKAAIKLARSNHVRMINRDELIQIGIDLKKNKAGLNESVQNGSKSILNDVVDKQFTNKVEPMIAATMEAGTVSANELEELLKKYRLEKSRESGMKAYHIFTNQTLDELVEKRPGTIEELRKLRGIGEKKIADFGGEIVRVIRDLKL